ncbi:MAG: Smr/MutS family protein [Desulfobulbaceae bacterium]|nr:Smr/MutS family protein [Desulfobulbaceae bacterium]HIJ79152.1 Smr/MutS family protein [Deltaproteobacteria bacterium]
MKKNKPLPAPPTKGSSLLKKKSKEKKIRQLSLADDLGIIFSPEKEKRSTKNFATIFAKTIQTESLLKAIQEKNAAAGPKPPAIASLKKWPSPQDELDLHGHTAAEAEAKTDFFISRAKNSRLKTIRIITGKGLHSPQGPVLQGVVEAKLLEFRAQKKIIAYRWENNAKQKSGALIVYLA